MEYIFGKKVKICPDTIFDETVSRYTEVWTVKIYSFQKSKIFYLERKNFSKLNPMKITGFYTKDKEFRSFCGIDVYNSFKFENGMIISNELIKIPIEWYAEIGSENYVLKYKHPFINLFKINKND